MLQKWMEIGEKIKRATVKSSESESEGNLIKTFDSFFISNLMDEWKEPPKNLHTKMEKILAFFIVN